MTHKKLRMGVEILAGKLETFKVCHLAGNERTCIGRQESNST